MLTTTFRIWLQDPRTPPVWTGVKFVRETEQAEARCIQVTVEGNGHDLQQLIAQRQDIFAASYGPETGSACMRAGSSPRGSNAGDNELTKC